MKRTFQFKKKNQLHFHKRNPFTIKKTRKNQKVWNFAFKFKLQIHRKNNQTKKKVHQKIEIDFNFTKEIHLKCIRSKKNEP